MGCLGGGFFPAVAVIRLLSIHVQYIDMLCHTAIKYFSSTRTRFPVPVCGNTECGDDMWMT